MTYDFIYKLKIVKEDIKHGGEGWYRLRWRPIKNGTYNFYISRRWNGCRSIGIRIFEQSTHNGWARGWDGIGIDIDCFFFDIHFWAIYNILVHKDGPSDVSHRKPLDIPDES